MGGPHCRSLFNDSGNVSLSLRVNACEVGTWQQIPTPCGTEVRAD
jgi:hypothetical protein